MRLVQDMLLLITSLHGPWKFLEKYIRKSSLKSNLFYFLSRATKANKPVEAEGLDEEDQNDNLVNDSMQAESGDIISNNLQPSEIATDGDGNVVIAKGDHGYGYLLSTTIFEFTQEKV